MSTADRTTVKAAINELTTKLTDNLVADPPTSAKPFRRIGVGESQPDAFARPFLMITLTRSRPIGVTENDRLIEIQMQLRAVVDVTAAVAHDVLLDAIGAIEDYFDSIIDTGVIDGAEGFDNRVWSFDYPSTTSGARLAVASAGQTFIVKVERQQNLTPAP